VATSKNCLCGRIRPFGVLEITQSNMRLRNNVRQHSEMYTKCLRVLFFYMKEKSLNCMLQYLNKVLNEGSLVKQRLGVLCKVCFYRRPFRKNNSSRQQHHLLYTAVLTLKTFEIFEGRHFLTMFIFNSFPFRFQRVLW
jgi:hypothetical protein